MSRLVACALLLIAVLLASAAAYNSIRPLPTSTPSRMHKLTISALLSSALIFASPFASHAENDALEGAFRAMNGKSYSALGKSLNKAIDFSNSDDMKKAAQDKPASERSLKRKAMAMCKDIFMLGRAGVSQIECNNRVNNNDYAFLLDVADKK